MDNERHKAFHYLNSKKLITITPITVSPEKEILSVMITGEGIDYVETEVVNRSLSK